MQQDIKKGNSFWKRYLSWAVLIILVLGSLLLGGIHMTPSRLGIFLLQYDYVIVLTVGMALITISGAPDLAIGGEVMVLSMTGAMMLRAGIPSPWMIVLVVVVSVLISLSIYAMTWLLKLPIVIISIPVLILLQGIVDAVGMQRPILIDDGLMTRIGEVGLYGFSIQTIAALVLLALLTVLFRRMYFGQYVYAVGSNRKAAALAGINVARVQLMVFVLYGIITGIGSVLYLARMGSAQPTLDELGLFVMLLTAVLAAGISIKGGTGEFINAAAGALIVAWIDYLMVNTPQAVHYRNIIRGILLLAALAYDYLRNRKQVET